jgi:hypothetical protein
MNRIKIGGTSIPLSLVKKHSKDKFIKFVLSNKDNLFGIKDKELVLSELYDKINGKDIQDNGELSSVKPTIQRVGVRKPTKSKR